MKYVRLSMLLALLMSLNTTICFAEITEAQALSHFVSASTAYQDGQYKEAVKKYTEILTGERESGAVYYNLANSYFRSRELGRAILNYERARRLMPRDSDLNFNYAYAGFQMEHYENGTTINVIDRLLRGHAEFYSLDEMVLIIVGIIFAIGCLFLASLYMNWPNVWRRGVLTSLFLGFLIFTIGLMAKVEYERDLAVAIYSGKSYFEPRRDSTVHFKLPEGMKAKILKSKGEWTKIQRLDGKSGWVSKNMLEKI